MAPKTQGGRFFCIFYALCGIPLFTALMVGVGERLQKPCKKLRDGTPWIKNNPERDKTLKTAVVLITGILVLVFPSSIGFTATQSEWTFLDSVYYTVITLTTVGFGDLMPWLGQGTKMVDLEWTYILARMIIMSWILIGLSWVSLIVSELSSLVTNNLTSASENTTHRLGIMHYNVKTKAKKASRRILSSIRSKTSIGVISEVQKDEYSTSKVVVAEDIEVKPNQTEDDEVKPYQTEDDEVEPNQTEDVEVNLNQTEDVEVKLNQTEDDEVKQNQTVDDEIKPNQTVDNEVKQNQTEDMVHKTGGSDSIDNS